MADVTSEQPRDVPVAEYHFDESLGVHVLSDTDCGIGAWIEVEWGLKSLRGMR